jgi:ABC-2 type transport system permease protein
MSLKAVPALLKVGFIEALTYRTDMVLWVLSTTMPLVMMLLWTSIAEVAPVQGLSAQKWTSANFIGYFLCVFIVRQLVAAWAAWEINREVRHGALAARLLKPLHPLIAYAASNIAYVPMRMLVTVPVVLLLMVTHAEALSREWKLWALWPFSILGAWLVTFGINVTVGATSFFVESSLKLMNLWFALSFVFSGYLVPLEFFPSWLYEINRWLPFRFVLALPVDIMMGHFSFEAAAELVAKQYLWVFGLVCSSLFIWRRGIVRFQAVGG